jgi:hypothetical protein
MTTTVVGMQDLSMHRAGILALAAWVYVRSLSLARRVRLPSEVEYGRPLLPPTAQRFIQLDQRGQYIPPGLRKLLFR